MGSGSTSSEHLEAARWVVLPEKKKGLARNNPAPRVTQMAAWAPRCCHPRKAPAHLAEAGRRRESDSLASRPSHPSPLFPTALSPKEGGSVGAGG